MTESERLAHKLIAMGRENAMGVIRAYSGLLRDSVETMAKYGWEPVNLPLGTLLHENGQPVQWVGRKAFVLPADVYQQRRSAALEDAKRRDEATAPKVTAKPGEALTSVLCPSCKSLMAKQLVCPKCEKGQAGFKIVCICTQCNHEVYL